MEFGLMHELHFAASVGEPRGGRVRGADGGFGGQDIADGGGVATPR
jgi:hypothetical protein